MQSTIVNNFVEISMFGKPENGGTRIWMKMVLEPPGNMPNLAEALISVSGIPQWMKNILLEIKAQNQALG